MIYKGLSVYYRDFLIKKVCFYDKIRTKEYRIWFMASKPQVWTGGFD